MSVARNDVVAILRVENTDFLDRNVEHAGNLVEVHAVVHHHCVDNKRLFRQSRVDVVLLIVVHHIGGSDEGRHITTGFARQIFVNRPKVGVFVVSALGTAERLVHIGRATVVGTDRRHLRSTPR